MSMPAHAVSFPMRETRAARTGGIAHALIAALFLVIVGLLFAVSSGLLWEFGINYSGITGSMASKIHPATYLTVVTFALFVLARRNPASFFVGLITRHPGTLTFLMATLLLAAYIVLDDRRGIANIVDTYLIAIMVGLIAAELDPRELARVEKLIHILLAANAALALVEYAINHRFFPYRFEGAAFEWETRSAGLLGHPLENAQMTGVYIMVLLGGGGVSMPKTLRPAAVLLQLAAMVPFGGRTALLLTLAMTTLWMLPRILSVLRGARMSLPAFAAVAVLTPLLAFTIGMFAVGGFFDIVLGRFANDGGSAQSRVAMFEIFNLLSWRDILVGPNADVIESIRTTMGLEWGIENPIVRMLVYQGAIFTGFLLAGFTLFMIEIGRRLRPGSAMAFIFFLIVINSYESIANKSLALAQFVVLMLVMFQPGGRDFSAAPDSASQARR